MKKEDVYDDEINPDGISENLEDLDENVFTHGYFCETEDGIWYEVYVTDNVKEYYPELTNEEEESEFAGFHDLYLDNYEENNQLTFFVPNDEEEFTLEQLSDIFA